MTRLLISTIGSYPRVGEDKDQQRHRRAYAHFQNREISQHALTDVEQSVTQEVIREQVLAGLDEVTDGMINWQDPITHFCRNLSGIRVGGLMRLFNTNRYYRIPSIISKPKAKEPALLKEFLYAKSVSGRPLRAVLTGPLTLAHHTASAVKPFNKLAGRVALFTDLLAQEINGLANNGATLIQIDEPSLAQHPEDLPLFLPALAKLLEQQGPAKMILALYFFPLAAVYPKIKDLPLYSLNLDFTNDRAVLTKAVMDSPPATAALGFGLLDARAIRPENEEEIHGILDQWSEKAATKVFYLTPSAGLEFLPRAHALEKISLLSKIKDSRSEPNRAVSHYA